MQQLPLNSKDIITKILIGAILILCVLALFNFTKSFSERIFFPYGLSYGEPICANPVINMAQNPWIYDDPQSMPYVIVGYPPLFFYIAYVAKLIWGSVFTAGRFVNFLALLITLISVYFLLRKAYVKTAIAILGSLFLLLIPAHREIGLKMTVDSVALMFSTLGLLVFFLNEKVWDKTRRSNTIYLILGAVLSVLAIFTKQTFVIALAAYAAHLLLSLRFKDILTVIGTTLLVLGSLVVIFQIGSKGLFLDQTVTRLAGGKIYLELIPRFWSRYFIMNFAMFSIAIASVPFFFRRGVRRLFVLYFILAFASTFAVGKIGSHMNYFLELSLASIILASLTIQDLLKHKRAQKALIAILIFILAQSIYLTSADLKNLGTRPHDMKHDLDMISKWIQRTPGPILSEDMGLLIANKRPIVYEPFEFNQLARVGLWDENILLDMLKRREFKLIILQQNIINTPESQRFSRQFTNHVLAFYKLVSFKHGYFVIIPKDS